MSDAWPIQSSDVAYESYPTGDGGSGAGATANASNNVKGVYSEITSSLGIDATAVIISVMALTAPARRYLIDIATGANGAETVRVANILGETTSNNGAHTCVSHIMLPLAVAAGTRVAHRIQCSTGGATSELGFTFIKSRQAGAQTFVTYGANTSDSGGTQVDPGGSTNTKGSWSQITASTTENANFLALIVTNQGNSGPNSLRWAVDLGIGSSPTVLVGNMRCNMGAAPGVLSPRCFSLPVFIPAGSELSVRASCTGADATDRLLDVQLLTANLISVAPRPSMLLGF